MANVSILCGNPLPQTLDYQLNLINWPLSIFLPESLLLITQLLEQSNLHSLSEIVWKPDMPFFIDMTYSV